MAGELTEDDLKRALGELREMISWSRPSDPASFDVASPEIPVTEEMIAAGYDLWLGARDDFERADCADIYRAMRAKEPLETSLGFTGHLIAKRDAAIARAEAAERHRKEMFELKEHYRSRMHTAETRLAERDASARRWVKFGCVLALLLPIGAHAQPQQVTYTPLQQTLLNQAAQCETVLTSVANERRNLQEWQVEAENLSPGITAKIAAAHKPPVEVVPTPATEKP